MEAEWDLSCGLANWVRTALNKKEAFHGILDWENFPL